MTKKITTCLIPISVVIIAGITLLFFGMSPKNLVRPAYLTEPAVHHKRFLSSEVSVFDALTNDKTENMKFVSWFNALNEEEKRGFILFTRSAALSSVLRDKVNFTDKDWMTGTSRGVTELAGEFMKNIDIMNLARQYEDIYLTAEEQRALFLKNNRWIRHYLDENFTDFKKGLFYFFAEHSFDYSDVITRSNKFSALEYTIMNVSDAIVASRGNNSRISPKPGVSDAQIRELVASSFFAKLFYGVPADFMLLISAYETNFSMEYWAGGFGATQQTIRSANTVLQSGYWINRVYQASGVRIRDQIVPKSALDNVFLCITEAAKTIAIKAAELRIKTDEINSVTRVRFAGQLLPTAWATAYKYNGSEKYARQYANNINYYYKKRKWWLKSFRNYGYRLYALNN
ncbi:hypothetical protein BMS3Abin07_02379 [bacterium BMS3Abin07]|nr:hypothetical protein BMS3Abin07_02379 [bacterium BMS3Abin07]GBE31404.1 hypothetical protein BMS3Bbin05_00304 [bacterium BMS3Bbin05]HDL20220.1 hypothetical protein [Nitrospirota bacterium]HDO22376.1 hypothetical protein [Nitrospirota bacterium]HDZ87044.1 hypothetical protein [Nitrospirota bacterium]